MSVCTHVFTGISVYICMLLNVWGVCMHVDGEGFKLVGLGICPPLG